MCQGICSIKITFNIIYNVANNMGNMVTDVMVTDVPKISAHSPDFGPYTDPAGTGCQSELW